MPTLLLRFPGGRYHATPWGHHVNEGLVEWPPSPWRLLRALVACGYATQGWQDVPAAACRLIEALAATLPTYRLPQATVAHTRHFMPTGVFEKGRERTTLVFDAWADVGATPVLVRWDCTLDDESATVFARLASHLGYVGRSESWVEAEAVPDDRLPAGQVDAYPHLEGQRGDRGWEQVSLMAAETAGAYADWRQLAIATALAPFPLPKGKKKVPARLLKDRERASAPYPVDLVNSLQRDSVWWKSHKWSQPPGSRRVLYWRRTDSLSVGPPVRVRLGTPAPIPMMLLALTTPSGSRSALPSRTRALPQAELVHRALVARVGDGKRADCPEFTGKDGDGRPLTGHRHAHILPADLDGDGRLDHILIHAKMGLGPTAQSAVRALERTWTKGGVGVLQLALAGCGTPDCLRTLLPPLRAGVVALLGPPEGAQEWRSFTPLVLPRHQKPRGPNTLENQILAELVSRGLPAATVEVLPWTDQTLELRHTVRVRRFPAKPPPVDAGFAVRLVFDVPVFGPIALGYGSHFGLGVFVATDEPG